MVYDWDLMTRVLHEVQNSADKHFAPRAYAEEEAAARDLAGAPVDNLDHLKTEATNYESLLYNGGFIESRPESEGGTGDNFVLTERGSQLLALIDPSYPGSEHPRELLDAQGEAALVPEVFDELAQQAVRSD
ncbi:transcriptional regulator [Pseudomonas sp. UL073]|uniref:Transcriptional regulator n=1 Tax=Zestomonas insulae TaxID=2809017 RepID=A0ABS2IFM8_9GAMM|nr:transcriptional regulator [Pseudomonas insulae]MBM7060633.1 transcriptional regulator [Pseudomonas insulae]